MRILPGGFSRCMIPLNRRMRIPNGRRIDRLPGLPKMIPTRPRIEGFTGPGRIGVFVVFGNQLRRILHRLPFGPCFSVDNRGSSTPLIRIGYLSRHYLTNTTNMVKSRFESGARSEGLGIRGWLL